MKWIKGEVVAATRIALPVAMPYTDHLKPRKPTGSNLEVGDELAELADNSVIP